MGIRGAHLPAVSRCYDVTVVINPKVQRGLNWDCTSESSSSCKRTSKSHPRKKVETQKPREIGELAKYFSFAKKWLRDSHTIIDYCKRSCGGGQMIDWTLANWTNIAATEFAQFSRSEILDGQVGVVFAAGNGTCESRLKGIASEIGMQCCSLSHSLESKHLQSLHLFSMFSFVHSLHNIA